jgi:dTDP-4-dehydrorhamnose 3,5-epimerase
MAGTCSTSSSTKPDVRVVQTTLPGVLLVEPEVHRDPRGFFLETYRADAYGRHGIDVSFVQDNHSRSVAGTLRGLHLQVRRPQAKLIRVVEGEIYDVAVDVRRGSPTFGRWVAVTLSAENFRQCYIPRGFAHGFCVTSATAQIEYKCSDVYDPGGELGIRWDDPSLAISWPVGEPILSARDRGHPALDEVAERLPRYEQGAPPTKV